MQGTNEETIAGGSAQTGETESPVLQETSEVRQEAGPPINSATSVTEKKDKGPNVILSKERKDEALGEGITNIGMLSFTLPDKATQLAGFYVEDAGVLVAQYRQYKFIQHKGKEVPNIQI